MNTSASDGVISKLTPADAAPCCTPTDTGGAYV